MKTLIFELRASLLATLIIAVVGCGIYPLLVFGVAQLLFPAPANGSLIVGTDGTIHGSRLIGQQFTGDKYFQSRPSNAGANGMSYDPTSSGGSNLGPTSQKLRDAIAQNLAAYRQENGLATNAPVPADAVTASASGLDPHISPGNAALQAPRVARVRGLNLQRVQALIQQYTDTPSLGFLGDPGVKVLELNLALDGIK